MAAGPRRFGKPRTDAERRRRHKRLYGTSNLPRRGTGLRQVGVASRTDPVAKKAIKRLPK